MVFTVRVKYWVARRLRAIDRLLESPTRPLVKVVGIFRTGTNLTRDLLENHYRVKITYSKWGWKHGLPPTLPVEGGQLLYPVHTLVMTRDPVMANLSLYNFWKKTRPELDTGSSFSAFIRRNFIVYDNSSEGMPHYLYRTPTEYWNQFYYSYLHWGAARQQLHFLPYEKLVSDTHTEIEAIAAWSGLTRKSTGAISLPHQEVLPSSDNRITDNDEQFFIRTLQVNPEDTAFIWSLVHRATAKYLGYLPPTPVVTKYHGN